MIRGWRNDPKWVEYYERKRSKAHRQAARMERIRTNTDDARQRLMQEMRSFSSAVRGRA